MPRAKNAKADEALELYRQGLKLIEIANRLNLPEGTIRRWKHTYHWNNERSEKKANVRKRGGQPGNRNRAAPKGNKRAEKFGFYAKYLPEETIEIFGEIADADPLDLLWDQIRFSYTAIVRAQKIAYVKDQQDKTIGILAGQVSEEQAWDMQANFMKAQSRAMDTLRGLLKQYDEMVNARGASATEEQRLRLEKLRAETDRLKRDVDPDEGDGVEVINDAPPG